MTQEELLALAREQQKIIDRCTTIIQTTQAKLTSGERTDQRLLQSIIERASAAKSAAEVRLRRLRNAILPTGGGGWVEDEVFQAGASYGWLPDTYNIPGVFVGKVTDCQEHGPFSLIPTNSNVSNEIFNLHLSGGRYACNNNAASWGEHGPKWFLRNYNVAGGLADMLVWRVGDWSQGREGHVCYFNVQGDLVIKNLIGVQHGAQLVQLVWRDHETALPQSMWPVNNPNSTVTLQDLVSVDGGLINLGMAVRASWPISFFNPGHKFLMIDGFKQRTNHAVPFPTTTAGPKRSHGGILTGGDPNAYQGKSALLKRLDMICADPDRDMIRAWHFDEFIINDGLIRVTNADGAVTPWQNDIGVANNVKHFEIKPEVDFTGTVYVFDNDKPYSANKLAVFPHHAGEHLVIDATKYQ
jgi:hypothetical protein